MASQQVRNMINNQIDSLLVRAEAEIRNEGKKKLQELQNELMTPDTILKALKVDINSTTCSASGVEKYERVRQQLLTKVTRIKDLLSSAKEKLEGVDGKVRPIVRGEGPVGVINDLKSNIIDPIVMPILKALSLAIPIALFILKGPIADGFMSTELRQKLVDAKTKIKELEALMIGIPFMLMFYQRKAERIMSPLDKLLAKLTFILDEIGKIEAFIHSLYLNHVGGCDELANASNESVNSDTMTGNEGGNVLPNPDGPTPLDQYLSLLKDQYEDVYAQVLNSTNKKYVERVFALKETLEEDYNISFKTIKN